MLKELLKRLSSSINATGATGITIGTFDLAGLPDWGRVICIVVGMICITAGEMYKYKLGFRKPIMP